MAVLSMALPVRAQANSLSAIPTEDITGVPDEIYQDAEVIGHQFNVCPELLMAIAEHESRFTADAVNGSCKGLMQLNLKWHKERFEEMQWDISEWDNPYINMYIAADYLKDLFDEYEDVGIVLGVYHGESGAVKRGKSGNLSSYVTKILERSEELERLNGK